MKKYSELMEDIRAELKKIEALKTEVEAATNQLFDSVTWEDIKRTCAEREEKKAKLAALEESKKDAELKIKYLKHNARISLFHEVAPVLLDVLKKYEGKPAGPKTKEKIMKEIKDLTGYSVWFGSDYGLSYYASVSPGYHSYINSIEIKSDYKAVKMIDEENRFRCPAAEDLYISGVKMKYFENPEAAVQEAKKARLIAIEKEKEFRKACAAFNEFAIDGIDRLQAYCEIRGL